MKHLVAMPVWLGLALAIGCTGVRPRDAANNNALLAKVEVVPLKPLRAPRRAPALEGRRAPSDHSNRVCTRFLEMGLARVSKADVNWRYRTHTGRVSDIVQYAILTPNQADELARKGVLPARQSSGSKLVEGPLSYTLNLTDRAFVAGYKLEGAPGRFAPLPATEHAFIGGSVGIRVLGDKDGSFQVNLEVSYSPWWPLGRKKPIRNAVEPRVLRVGFGPGAAAFKVERPVVQPVEFKCQFSLRPNQTLLLTRHDMASRNPRTGREQQAFVMVTISQENGPRLAAR